MARVRIENLCKIFKGPRGREMCAVHDANLTVEHNELLVLLGPSGCGKSTTLRLIAGLEEITRGTISIDDQVVNDLEPSARDIAMVFQNDALYPHLTVYENMAFGLKLRKLPGTEIDYRVNEAMEILGLQACRDSLPKTLSGGQRQRVALGRAIVRKPKVFLFDEPLSNLDARLRAQMRLEIAKLQTRLAATMIFVTHDQVEAMTIADRIAIMKDGVIQQVAEPMRIYNQPVNLFVAGFIGLPPMNFFRGVFARQGNKLRFLGHDPQGAATRNFSVPLNHELSPKLAAFVGKPLVFGIRPENITDKPQNGEAAPDGTVDAVVELIEPTGPETYLHLTTGSCSFVARVHPSDPVTVNQKMSLVFDMRKARFFDPTTEQAIA